MIWVDNKEKKHKKLIKRCSNKQKNKRRKNHEQKKRGKEKLKIYDIKGEIRSKGEKISGEYNFLAVAKNKKKALNQFLKSCRENKFEIVKVSKIKVLEVLDD